MNSKASFIQTNDRLVNLLNVSNINIISRDNRIVFNMNYYIEIEKRGEYRLISDYCYWDLISESQMTEAQALIINNNYFKENFITYNGSSVNIDEISSIKFSDKKKRIIFNLSHSVSFTDYNGNSNITSEFVYFNYDSYSDYKDAENKLKLKLNLKG